MANIAVGRGFWFALGDATFLQPEQIHNWFWPLGNLNEAITITAFPLAAFNTGVIIVEGLKISEGFQGRLALFTVRNVGGTPIQEYGLTGSFIS
jgi:hypothetical protein